MLQLACTGHLAQLVEQRNSTWLEQHINVLVIGSSPIVATTIFFYSYCTLIVVAVRENSNNPPTHGCCT